MNTKVYVYGLASVKEPVHSNKPNHPGFRFLPPIPSNLDRIIEQLVLSNRYRNSLVEMDRERRAKKHEIRARYEWEEISELKSKRTDINASVKALRTVIKERNKGARRIVGSKEEQAEIKRLQEEAKALSDRIQTLMAAMPKVDWDRVKEIKNFIKQEKSLDEPDTEAIASWQQEIHELRSVDPAYLELSQLETWAKQEHNRRRSLARLGEWQPLPWETSPPQAKLFWGNYQSVDEAYGLMFKSANEPQFRRFDGDGKVSYHFQNDEVRTWKDLTDGTNNKLTLRKTTDLHRGSQIWEATLWFASVKAGVPIYTTFRFVCHREPQPEAKVNWVYLVRKEGKWTLQLVLSEPDRHERGEGTVAINLGWRIRGNGIRCLYAVKENGEPLTLQANGEMLIDRGEAIIPATQVARQRHYRDLAEIRDKRYNEVLAMLCKALEGQTLTQEQIALFVREEVTQAQLLVNLGKWKSKDRLLGLVDRLLPKGEAPAVILSPEATEALLAYRRWSGEPHLHLWLDRERSKFALWRSDYYRKIGATLRQQFARVLIDGTDYRDIARTRNPEKKKDYGVKDNKDVVSPSILRNIIAQALPTTELDPGGITQTCHLCGFLNQAVGVEVSHECDHCGETADIDYRACMNLLALSERGGGGRNTGDRS